VPIHAASADLFDKENGLNEFFLTKVEKLDKKWKGRCLILFISPDGKIIYENQGMDG